MGTLSTVALSLFLLAPLRGAAAEPKTDPPAKPIQMKFIGEGDSYSHASPEAIDAMETAAAQEGAAGGTVETATGETAPSETAPDAAQPDTQTSSDLEPQQPSAPQPSAKPSPAGIPALHPTLLRPRPSSSRPQAAARTRSVAAPDRPAAGGDRRRYSLWDGLVSPMELPSHKINNVSDDEAASMVRQDYDTHILSQRNAVPANAMVSAPPSAAMPAAVMPAAAAPAAPAPAAAGSDVFVALNLDLKNNPDTTLKDAVADLGRTAGFRQDMRFEPAAIGAGPDQVALWGWMPPNRLGEALKVPSVARLEVNSEARRSSPATTTDMLMGVRVPRGVALADVLKRLEADLAVSGLRVKRSIGTQTAPGTGETVLVVEASVPINALSRLMGHPKVVKMVSAPQASTEPARPQDAAARIAGFGGYVASHAPILLVLTLLMLLPWVGAGLTTAARVFVPYR